MCQTEALKKAWKGTQGTWPPCPERKGLSHAVGWPLARPPTSCQAICHSAVVHSFSHLVHAKNAQEGMSMPQESFCHRLGCSQGDTVLALKERADNKGKDEDVNHNIEVIIVLGWREG